MNMYIPLNESQLIIGWVASSNSIKAVEDIQKRKSKEISEITLVPVDQISSGKYSDDYNKKMSQLCAVLMAHLEENNKELFSREVV